MPAMIYILIIGIPVLVILALAVDHFSPEQESLLPPVYDWERDGL